MNNLRSLKIFTKKYCMIVQYGITDTTHRLEQLVTIRFYIHVSINTVNTRLSASLFKTLIFQFDKIISI
jgi:hypothetical protein